MNETVALSLCLLAIILWACLLIVVPERFRVHGGASVFVAVALAVAFWRITGPIPAIAAATAAAFILSCVSAAVAKPHASRGHDEIPAGRPAHSL